MRTEHYRPFDVLGITPKSRAKGCAQWRILKPPVASKAMVLVSFLLYVNWVDVLCLIS